MGTPRMAFVASPRPPKSRPALILRPANAPKRPPPRAGILPLPPARGGGRRQLNGEGGERGFIRGRPARAGKSRFPESTMAIGTALLGLLAFLLGCSGTSAEPRNSERFATRKCALTGTWVSDQGSKMVISESSNSGVFSGSYLTAMAATAATIRSSPLQGIQHRVDQRAQPTFGFTVNWSFADSTAVFAGQCFLDGDGEEQLKTTWLLRGEVGSVAEDWGATRVGTDTFYRTK